MRLGVESGILDTHVSWFGGVWTLFCRGDMVARVSLHHIVGSRVISATKFFTQLAKPGVQSRQKICLKTDPVAFEIEWSQFNLTEECDKARTWYLPPLH